MNEEEREEEEEEEEEEEVEGFEAGSGCHGSDHSRGDQVIIFFLSQHIICLL